MGTTDARRVKPLVEACCDSIETACAAQSCGAGRIELCGAGDGGTTPSLGMIAHCREQLVVPMAVMIRPRAGDFVYTEQERDVMSADIMTARALGVNVVVLGILRLDGTVDEEAMLPLVGSARPMQVTFHRAFDRTPDAQAALDTLLALGIDTVLTAGHGRLALDGVPTLASLRERAGEQLTVMAGGGVRAHNVHEIVSRSGVRAVHARATDSAVFAALTAALGIGPA